MGSDDTNGAFPVYPIHPESPELGPHFWPDREPSVNPRVRPLDLPGQSVENLAPRDVEPLEERRIGFNIVRVCPVQKIVNCHGKTADVKEHGLSRSVARVAKRKVGGKGHESDNEEIEVQKSPTVEATPTAAIDDGMALDDHDFLGLDFAEESSTTDGRSSGGLSVLTMDMLRKRTHSDIEAKGSSQPSSRKRAKLSGGDAESDGDEDDTISRTILIQDLGEGRGEPFYDDVEQAWPTQGDWSQAIYLGSPASSQRLFLIHRWLQTFHFSIADITEA
ncbi:hypothetical protein EV421DRAFT_1905842 [Armillaria borealis]|uniref:Uncharacterized protein n=1 Tax=Armillaria borealis TaxID=47425 RepID=A0AA39MLT0_9AGAR|nr:hypothetical protein EV421DRAFT_1905842 [Armillaria borealis]